MDAPLSPTIQRLRTFKSRPRSEYLPKGNKDAKLNKALAQRFCDLLAESDKSVPHLLRENPDLPPFKTLFNWQQRVPWFNAMWKAARVRQTHFLAEKCLDLYNQAEPKTAHVVRIKFDVLKWFVAKFNPADYGDKPLPSQQSTTVNVGISIDPQRLTELRSKLDQSRTAFKQPSVIENASRTLNGSEHAKRIEHSKREVTSDPERAS